MRGLGRDSLAGVGPVARALELVKALEACRRQKAKLVIAKDGSAVPQSGFHCHANGKQGAVCRGR